MNNIVNFHFDNFRIWFFFHLKFEILILILVILEFENFNFKKVGFTIKTNFNWMNNTVDDLFMNRNIVLNCLIDTELISIWAGKRENFENISLTFL